MSKISPKLVACILVTLFFAVALFLRTVLPHDGVFVGDWIKFSSGDAYYHMRLVDNLVHNFPNYLRIDPYFIYPGASEKITLTFFDWLLAAIIWVIGLGSPDQHTIDVIAVYIPPVLGALTVIPVYFIGKELFGRWAGVLAAALIAIVPGEFMGRSILGFADHDVADVLFVTISIMFFIMAIRSAKRSGFTLARFKHGGWKRDINPIVYSILAGIFLGIYILSWAGALIFVFILALFFVIQFVIDHLKGKSTDYLCLVGVVTFLVAVLIYPLIYVGIFYLIPLIIGMLLPLVLNGLSRLMTNLKIKPVYYPISVLGLGLVAGGILYLVSPSLVGAMVKAFSQFIPTATSLATIEQQPLLFPAGSFSLAIALGNYNVGFVISLISLGVLIYLVIRRGDAGNTLIVVWSLAILLATLFQRRFGIYYAVNVTLLTGYLSWRGLNLVGFRDEEAAGAEAAKEEKTKRPVQKKGGYEIVVRRLIMSLSVVIVFFVVYYWNIQPAIATAQSVRYAPSDAWVSSMYWLKDNTPEPFGNPDFYYELPQLPSAGQEYQYPESAYGVTAWWDYGYWITRIGRRIPSANPSQDPIVNEKVGKLFTAQDEESGTEIIKELDSSYLILDYESATTKYWAIATWAGNDQSEFLELCYMQQENQVKPVVVFYPDYYRALSTRLYYFDGKAVTPSIAFVISYQEVPQKNGGQVKLITSAQQFNTYEEAETYLNSQTSGNYRIVGVSPFSTPVPLDPVQHFELVHSSEQVMSISQVGEIPALKYSNT